MAVCSAIHTQPVNSLCEQNVEILNVKLVIHKMTTGSKVLNLCYKKQSVDVV